MHLPSLVLALLPLALGNQERGVQLDLDPRYLPAHSVRRAPGYRACLGSKHGKRAAPPELGVGGLSVGVHGQEQPRLERRAANGSIIALGSAAK